MFERLTKAGPFVLAAILAAGITTVLLVLIAWGMAIIDNATRAGRVVQRLGVRADGTPFILSYTDNYMDRSYRTLDHRPLEISVQESRLAAASLPGRAGGGRWLWAPSWNGRLAAFADDQRPPNYWYFMHDGKVDGRGYFIGFDSRAKLPIGYIGASGFSRAPPPRDEHFAYNHRWRYNYGGGSIASRSYAGARTPAFYVLPGGDGVPGWMVYLISGRRLLEVDLKKRTVRTLLQADDLQSVSIATVASPAAEPGAMPTSQSQRQLVAVRLTDRIQLIDRRQGELAAYPIPENLRHEDLTLYLEADRTAIVQVSRSTIDGGVHHRLAWIETDGHVSRQEEVTLVGNLGFANGPRGMQMALSLPTVPIITTAYAGVALPLDFLRTGEATRFFGALGRSLAVAWPSLFFTYAVAAYLAWVCYRRQRRYDLPRAWVWAVFVFLTGLPGLLGYLFHRRWPPLEPCPSCERPAARDRPACSSCGAEFPRPTRKGIEVFAESG